VSASTAASTEYVDPAPEIVLPALLRAARGSYAQAIRARLAAAGCDDLPRNGPFLLGGVVNHGGHAQDLLRELGVSKQAASQLVDTLVVRGYLERQVDTDDRRRMRLAVTDRGRLAADATRAGVRAIDEELNEKLSPAGVSALRAGLFALIEIRERMEDEAR
jgi:DNA-binding MarR family transcriptional regulator